MHRIGRKEDHTTKSFWEAFKQGALLAEGAEIAGQGGGALMASGASAWKPRTSDGNSKESCVPVYTRMESFLGGVTLARFTHMQSFAVIQTSSWGL